MFKMPWISRKSHEAEVAKLTARAEMFRKQGRLVGATLAEVIAERDEARAKIARMTGGLRRGSKPANAA